MDGSEEDTSLAARLTETEEALAASKEMLEQSQSQYAALEKKYNKAKRMVQQRETDLVHKYEQIVRDKDAECESLRERVGRLERELLEGEGGTGTGTIPVKEELDRAVPQHELLDVSANRSKAELATRGALANRQLPTACGGNKKAASAGDASCGENKKATPDADDCLYACEKRKALNEDCLYAQVHKPIRSSASPATLAEQLKQVLAEREQRLGGGGVVGGVGGGGNTAQHLLEEIRQAVNEANSRVKKVAPVTLSPPGSVPWQQHHQQQLQTPPSPSSVSSSDSVSPSRPPDLSLSSSSITSVQSSAVAEWSKEQVCQWLLALGLDQHIGSFLQHQVGGNALLLLDSRDFKILGVGGDDKSRLKRKLKELKHQADKEKKQVEKERKEKEKVLRKAEKAAAKRK